MPVKSVSSKTEMQRPSLNREGIDTYRMMSITPVLPHHQVANLGCGTGYFTVPLAKSLFYGKLFALDVQQEMLDATRKAVEVMRLTNVELMLSDEVKIPLGDESLDGAFASVILEWSNDPKSVLQETLRCLKKAGWLIIMEWHKKKMKEGPPLKRRIGEDKLLTMAKDVGLRFSGRRNFNDRQYVMVFRK